MRRCSVLAQPRTSVCAGNGQALRAALKGARAVICTGRLGDLPSAAEQASLEHLIVVSSAGQPAAAYRTQGSSGLTFRIVREGCLICRLLAMPMQADPLGRAHVWPLHLRACYRGAK